MWTKEEWEAQGAFEAMWDHDWEERCKDEEDERYDEEPDDEDYEETARERGLI